MKRISIILLTVFSAIQWSQAQPGDTVVIKVGKDSRVTFAIHDKNDLETLKKFNFQALMDDMVTKLEKGDTTPNSKPSTEYLKDTTQVKNESSTNFDEWKDRDWDDHDRWERHGHRHDNRRTYHSFNIDIGMNNYLENGTFPDYSNSLYTVKPWGSWYVALNSVLRTRVTNRFFMEWGGGVSWYNFKFNNTKTVISKDDFGVIFSEDGRDVNFTKSKLTVAYVNAFLVPMVDFGGPGRKPSVFDGERFEHHRGFRIGAGPYVGYRIDSYTKQVWTEGGDKQKSHDHDNYYLNNIRYGIRAQIGFRGTDLFFNYDLNELFNSGKGPNLNAFSFGITL